VVSSHVSFQTEESSTEASNERRKSINFLKDRGKEKVNSNPNIPLELVKFHHLKE
jgi:hypothetical protein